MSLLALATAGLEQTLNALLALDPGATRKLARLHGQVIAVELQGLELVFYFIANEKGDLQVMRYFDGSADATISGSPLSLMRATDSTQGSAQLFSGEMQISGNTELAHNFSGILGGLDIDWEEQLSKFTGDIAAHQIGRAGRKVRTHVKGNIRTLENNLGEYLTEEARLLPSRLEAEDFLEQIDTLRDDTERLSARVQLLHKQARADS